MLKRESVSNDKKRFAARRSSGATSTPSESTSMSEEDEDTKVLFHLLDFEFLLFNFIFIFRL